MNFSEDCSLFIALTTAPLGKVEEQTGEIASVFNGYKKRQNQFSRALEVQAGDLLSEEERTASKEFQDFFYRPHVYYMFGDFDLAIISLVDDFTLSNRSFHPYSHFIKEEFEAKARAENKTGLKEHSLNFRYQIITGTATFIPGDKDYQAYQDFKDPAKPKVTNFENYDKSRLIPKARNTFLKGPGSSGRFPFIGITRIKLNNGLLIGGGAQFAGFIEIALQKILEREQERNPSVFFDFIITESFSWHELSLTLFCNDYKFMSDIIVGLREMSLIDIGAVLSPPFKAALESQHDVATFDSGELLAGVLQKSEENSIEREQLFQLQRIWKNCLVQYWLDHPNEENASDMDVGQSHVFVKTVTSFGYDPAILNFKITGDEISEHQGFHKPLVSLNEMRLLSRWHVKPGHARHIFEFNKSISEKLVVDEDGNQEEYYFVAGDSDYIFTNSRRDLLKTWISAGHYRTSGNNASLTQNVALHSRRINTLPRIFYRDLGDLYRVTVQFRVEAAIRPQQHYYFNKKLTGNGISFSLGELANVREWLYRCKVSKILREKVLHMFVNFNDGVQDPLLFTYFIELRRFLEAVRQFIQEQAEATESADQYHLSDLHLVLDEWVTMFDEAFSNRFHQSYITATVTDYNMEYNGGCQQILSALDALYKVSTVVFGDTQPYTSFAYVMGLTETASNIFSLRLNYFHVFQPSMLLALITKEAANFFEGTYPFLWTLEEQNSDKLAVRKELIDAIRFAEPENHLPVFQDIYDCCRAVEDTAFRTDLEQYVKYFSVGNYQEQEVTLENLGKMEELQESSDLLEYFKADILNYFYTYNMDSELFFYWYWNTWIEMSFLDNRDGIDPQNMIPFMMRVVFLLEYLDEAFLNKLKHPPAQQLGAYWHPHFQKIRKCARFLLQNSTQLQTWMQGIKIQAIILNLIDVGKPYIAGIEERRIAPNIIETVLYQNKSRYPSRRHIVDRVDRFLLHCREHFRRAEELSLHQDALDIKLAFTDHVYRDLRKKLESGQLNIFQHVHHRSQPDNDPDLKHNMVFYAHSYIYAYLRCLKEFNQHGPGQIPYNSVLYRDPVTGEIDSFEDEEDPEYIRSVLGGLLFDPMGGLFTANKSLKRKHLRIRSTLIRSLWDMSLKLKMQLFKGQLEKARSTR